jgi:hypothetical protein
VVGDKRSIKHKKAPRSGASPSSRGSIHGRARRCALASTQASVMAMFVLSVPSFLGPDVSTAAAAPDAFWLGANVPWNQFGCALAQFCAHSCDIL